jgi:glucuronate isomerase
MKKFLDENFLLQNKTAQTLYHDFAKSMPIIDYHNHLPPDQIANDINFANLTQVWLIRRSLQVEGYAHQWYQ